MSVNRSLKMAAFVLAASTVTSLAQSILPPASTAQDKTKWREHSGTWTADPAVHALRGMNGGYFTSASAPEEFSIMVKMRYDELRFFARPPFSGIAFHGTDAKNYDAIVLADDECQLAYKQVRNGLEKIVVKSEEGLYTEVGEPFFLRVSISAGKLEGALSLDGVKWKTVLQQPLPSEEAKGRVGLIAGAPATWFAWGDDASSPLPRFVPYEYKTLREAPANAPSAPTKADYLKALQAISKLPLASGDSLHEQGLSSVRAWQLTHDDVWKQRAISAAHKMVAAYRHGGSLPIGFAAFYQEMVTLQTALDNHWLSPEESGIVPDIAAGALLHGQFERGPMNRALGNLVGIKPALALAPMFPQRAQAEKIAKLVENDFAEYGYAPIEDASDYIKVSLIFASIEALESRPDWWQQKGFHDAFLNFAAEISPLGRFPGFGDDDDADPLELMGLIELAGKKWGDATFHEAARRLWSVSLGRQTPTEVKSSEITSLALAATYAGDGPGMTSKPEAPLTIYQRANGEPSKAVFRNGDTWMMVDLFAGGEHGHNDTLAVTTLESGSTVQLEDNGRYARGTMFHNRPQFTTHAEDFPLRQNLAEQSRRVRQQYFTDGEWTHFHLPLHDHWIWGNFAGEIGLPTMQRDAYNPEIPAVFTYDPAQQTAFILDMRGFGEGQISLSDVTLSGPDGVHSMPLTIPAGAPSATVQTAAHDGKDAYVWHSKFGAQNLFLGGLAAGKTDAAAAKDTWLDFWLKIDPIGDSRVEINSVAIGDRDGYPKRFLDANNPNGATTVDVSETIDGGGHLVATEKIIAQNGAAVDFTRDIYQALPGLTWIRDTTRNAGPAGTAGISWYGVQPKPEANGDYDFATGLKLKLIGAKSRGIETRRSYGMRDQQIVFGSDQVAKDGTVTIDSLLITSNADWQRVNVSDGADVWSDGTHWVGRNPSGKTLHFAGFSTTKTLFVLSKEKTR
jgi:hypothetical protein